MLKIKLVKFSQEHGLFPKLSFLGNFLITILAFGFLSIQPIKVNGSPVSPIPVSLSLKATIEDALRNNISIAVQKYNSKIASWYWAEKRYQE